MKSGWVALACLLASTAAGQLGGGYQGPGVLSRGAGDIGTRSGQQVGLRLYAGVSGIYDNELQPVSVDPQGKLVQVGDLYGVEANVGAYGVHNWKTASLGLDYRGVFRHYNTRSYFDGSDHSLALGYTYRKSRRLAFDLRQVAGSFSQGVGGVYGFLPIVASDIINQPTLLLFDNRTYYLQSTMDVSYIASPRTIFTAGGDGFLVRRRASSLAGLNGYNLRGSIQHRISRTNTIGTVYEHIHFDYRKAFGEANIDLAQGFFATQFSRYWTFAAYGGIYVAQIEGLQQVNVDPAVAALLGQTTTIQAFYRKTIYPSGELKLTRQFKAALLTFDYSRTPVPGNGVYLTSQQESGSATFSYTGVRKFNFFVSGQYNALKSLGQNITPYRQVSGGAGLTYGLNRYLHLTARYDARHQEIDLAGYRRNGFRATVGLIFSPGDVPLSLW